MLDAGYGTLAAVAQLVGLNGREIRRAFPLFAYLFLTIAGSVASKAARDALFLDRFDATQLPYVDIAVAAIVGVVASLYLRLGSRINLRNLQICSLLAFALSSALFWFLASGSSRESSTLFIVIYIWVGVFSVLLPSQVWTLANFVMTTREAKRAFGFIGSGALLGWIVGGLATRESVLRLGTESMLLWVAVELMVCTGLVAIVWRARPSYVDGNLPAAGAQVGAQTRGLYASLRLIGASPYLRAITALVCLSAVVTTVVGWQFKATAKMHIQDTDQLAAFFGTFNVVAGLVSFALQLLLTGRVLKTAGIGITLFIVPMAIAAGSIGLLLLGTLAAAATLKASDQILRYSIDKVTLELLYTPVPLAQTFRVKSFIDTVGYRAGDALGGIVVLAFAAVLRLAPTQVSWVSLALIGGWIAAAVVARRQYVENLRDSIHQHRLDAERSSTRLIERHTADLLDRQLAGSAQEVLYALKFFQSADERRIHPAVRALLRHPSPEIRCRAIQLLAGAGDASARDDVERLLYDGHLDVRTEALLYLTQFAHIDPLERIETLGDFSDFSIRAAMVAFLSRPGRSQNIDAARVMLGAMVAEKGAAGERDRFEAARLLSTIPALFDRELEQLLEDESTDVVGETIRAVGVLRKGSHIERVIAALADPELLEVSVQALSAFGDSAVDALRAHLDDPETPAAVKREIPSALQAIGTRGAQSVLVEHVLHSDTVLRYRIIAALNKLGQQHPERRVDEKIIETVLAAEIMGHYRSYQVLGTLGHTVTDLDDPIVRSLGESMNREAERIFRLLKILRPSDDMHSAFVGLQSADPVVHDNTLELLEATLSPSLCALLVPLFDRDVSAAARAHRADQLLGSALGNTDEAIAVLAGSQDPWLQSCAAYAIGELRLVQFADTLDGWTTNADPLLRVAALDARRKVKGAEHVKALSVLAE